MTFTVKESYHYTHQSRTRTNGTRLTPEVLYPDHSRLLRELKSTKIPDIPMYIITLHIGLYLHS